MKQRPVVLGLLLCEQVLVDQTSRNTTPVNCFNTLDVEAFPGHVTFHAVAWLTDGLGEMPIELLVQRLDTLEEVSHVRRTAVFTDPLREIRCTIRVRRC